MSKRKLTLAVDYSQKWPLSDSMDPEPPVDWDAIITADLQARLRAWANFFDEYMDWETGLFGSEERRAWFDHEVLRLLGDLQRQAGHMFEFELRL